MKRINHDSENYFPDNGEQQVLQTAMQRICHGMLPVTEEW